MKGHMLKIGVAIWAMAACFAVAAKQDKDHDRDDKHHRNTVSRSTASKQRHSWVYSVEHRGRRSNDNDHDWDDVRHRRRRRSGTVVYRNVRTNPNTYFYQPHRIYSDRDWENRIHMAHRNRGKHLGWSIGRGNPHRIGGDHDRDDRRHHKGRGDLAYVTPNPGGFQLASWQNYGYQNDRYHQDRRNGGSRRNSNRRNSYRFAAGHYTNVTRWTKRGQEFVIQYTINLSNSGTARLQASSLQDRNMPNSGRNTDPHGDILKYMHAGHDVIQTGRFDQNGGGVTIYFGSDSIWTDEPLEERDVARAYG